MQPGGSVSKLSMSVAVIGFAVVMAIALPGVMREPGVFASFWSSGRQALQGLDPYALTAEVESIPVFADHVVEINLNPPILLPLFEAFALMPLRTGAMVWALVSGAIYFAAAWSLMWRYRLGLWPTLLLFLNPLTVHTLTLGQIYTVLLALAVIAWCAIEEERPVLAGILIGLLAAIKPPFIVLPVCLLLARHWRLGGAALVSAAGLSLLGVVLYGIGTTLAWARAAAGDTHWLMPWDASLRGLAYRFGHPMVGLVLAGLVLVALAGWCLWKRPAIPLVYRVVAPSMLLASPLAWPHYAYLAFPALVSGPWNLRRIIGAVMLSLPFGVTLILTHVAGTAYGGLHYTLGLALIAGSYLPLRPAAEPQAALA